MMLRLLGSAFSAAAVMALFPLASVPASGQAKAYVAPKAWDGHPDLSGIWQARNTAYVSLEPHTASLGMPAGTGVIVDPVDGKIPYRPEALAKRNDNFKKREDLDPVGKCYMSGVPRFAYMPFPFQIFQTPKYVVLISEYMHMYRTLYTDGSKHIEGLDFWNGDSRARWEGDTLVVDVTTFNDQTWFDMSGNHHSDALHVVERFTRMSDDVLTYEATIEDPKTFTRPWRIRMPLYRNTEPNARILEYECHSYLEDASK
jgi:hypothetical protein